jgi:hypothetical protein
VSIAAKWSDCVKPAAVLAALAPLVTVALLLGALSGCNDDAGEPSPGAGGPGPAAVADSQADEAPAPDQDAAEPAPAVPQDSDSLPPWADEPSVLIVDGLLNGGFELVADGTTDPPKYGAYWSGAFSTTPGDATSWVSEDRPFRGGRFLRLSHATTGVRQKIVADPRWAGPLSVSLAVRTYRGGELRLTLEDGRGKSVMVRIHSLDGQVIVVDEDDVPVEPILVRPGEDDWSQVVLPLGSMLAVAHTSPPVPRLVLHLEVGGGPRALIDVDEVHAAVAWPAVDEADLTAFSRELVRWSLDTWYLPRHAGGLGLVDPDSGYITRLGYHVETGAPGAKPKFVSFHTIHNLLMMWLEESRRRGWDEEVARWTPELRTITTTLLDHNFDEQTGLPRNVSAADLTPSDEAVTIGNYVEFLLDARELVDDEALAARCLAQARKIADTLVRLQAEHDIPEERAPPPPVWNAATGRLSGDTSNWFGHIADRLTPQGEIETDKRFRTSWAILTGRSSWYEMLRSPRAILRVNALDPRPGDVAAFARAVDLYHRDWDASRYDLENDTDDHYGYLCEDLLAPLRKGGPMLPEALALVIEATDHRLAPDADHASDTLWIQAVRLGTACAGDSPRAFEGPLQLYELSKLPLYRHALLELARNDLQGRQLSNAQFTESFFKDWEMVCICFRGNYQGDCRETPPEGGWHGDVGDTFGGPPTSGIDAQTAAYRVATPAERGPILGALGIIRQATESTLRREHGYVYGLDEEVARRYELPDKYVIGLQPVSAAGLGYVMAWMRLLPHLEESDAPDAPRVELVDNQLMGLGLKVSGRPGHIVALPAQVNPIPAPIAGNDPRMLALDVGANEGGLRSAYRLTIGPNAENYVPLDRLGLAEPEGLVQPLLLDPTDHGVLAIGAALALDTP